MATIIEGLYDIYLEMLLYGLPVIAIIVILVCISKHYDDKKKEEREQLRDEAARRYIERDRERRNGR